MPGFDYMIKTMLGIIPHQKFSFHHLPTRGRAGIKLWNADMLHCIYNFLLFHANVLHLHILLEIFYIIFWD